MNLIQVTLCLYDGRYVLPLTGKNVSGAFSHVFSARPPDQPQAHALILGIRPELITITKEPCIYCNPLVP